MENAIIGSAQLYYTTLTSTNLFAQLLLSKTRPRAGTVISTGFQSAGRGQFGRSWFGSKGTNLYVSVILYPQILATAQFTLSAFVALAIRDTVQHFIDQEVRIKWPNDIYVADRKIAGILIQNSLAGQTIQNSIIGMGLNVNETSFPEGVQNPTSLAIETGQKLDLAEVMYKLIEYLNAWHERAQKLPLHLLKKQYADQMYKLGELCRFQQEEPDEQFSARVAGVDGQGRILLEFQDSEAMGTLVDTASGMDGGNKPGTDDGIDVSINSDKANELSDNNYIDIDTDQDMSENIIQENRGSIPKVNTENLKKAFSHNQIRQIIA